MRVCIEKSTGKLIESQSGGDEPISLRWQRLNTLRVNAMNAGYKENDIEVKFVTEGEFQVILSTIPPPELTEEQANEEKVKKKMRELAIEALGDELPVGYK